MVNIDMKHGQPSHHIHPWFGSCNRCGVVFSELLNFFCDILGVVVVVVVVVDKAYEFSSVPPTLPTRVRVASDKARRVASTRCSFAVSQPLAHAYMYPNASVPA